MGGPREGEPEAVYNNEIPSSGITLHHTGYFNTVTNVYSLLVFALAEAWEVTDELLLHFVAQS